ncbi:MAG TPA: transporter substrate-binding domain-containing protein, partial [Desulfobacteria bacterium]|nr:transporter substrate-binding domain-containing protein [Desulfobacteria bacterium]
MKKTGILIAVLLALTLVWGCEHTKGGAATAQSVTALDRISQSGQLVVGTAASMPPLNMTTKSGEIIGLEPDMANMMGEAMGVKVVFKTMPFAELLPALEAGKVDMV